jgi:hypothetical protein
LVAYTIPRSCHTAQGFGSASLNARKNPTKFEVEHAFGTRLSASFRPEVAGNGSSWKSITV